MTSDTRQLRRTMALAQTRPQPPLGVRLSGSRLSWEEPTNKQGITHYLIRVGSDADSPRYKVAVGQNSCVLAGGDESFWVSSWNETGSVESPQAFCAGMAAGPGSADSIGNVTEFSASVEDGGDGKVRLILSGTLPVDESLQGLVFVIESPTDADLHPEDLTLPGILQVDCPEWYCTGDGSEFSASFVRQKPDGAEKWIVYALAFGAYASNYLKRVTQIDPPLPADVTPWAAVDLGDILTMEGSGLGDVTITGTQPVTPTGYGTLRIDLKYVPPYLAGPAISIGDFQGVTAYVEYADGTVKSFGDFPYLGNPNANPPDNLGEVSLNIPTPSTQTLYIQLCSYSTTDRLPFKPHGSAPSNRVAEVVISSGTLGGGLATQVGAFDVTVESVVPDGLASGGKEGRFLVTYAPPVDAKWRECWIERILCDSSYTPLSGATWGRLGVSTSGREYYGWWPWPKVTEYWRFRARSVNQAGEVNDTAYPQEMIALSADGSVTLANNSIAALMIQDLAVMARALADEAVTSTKYAPFSIGAAAIGLAAINNAQIHDLSIDKLTAAAGGITLQAGGAFTIKGSGGLADLTLVGGGFSSISGGVNISGGGSWSGAPIFGGGIYFSLDPYYITGAGDAYLKSLDLLTALSVTEGGTGANNAASARSNLGLGGAAILDVGPYSGYVAAGDHSHSGLEGLIAALDARITALEGA